MTDDELLREASDPTTPGERLRAIYSEADLEVFNAVVVNPSLPLDLLHAQLFIGSTRSWHNPTVALILMSEPVPALQDAALRALQRHYLPGFTSPPVPHLSPLTQLIQAWSAAGPDIRPTSEGHALAHRLADLFGLPYVQGVVTSEASTLLTALKGGDWRRLSSPLLEPALLAQPDAWLDIVGACALAIAAEAIERDEMPLLRWATRAAGWLRLGPEQTSELLGLAPLSASLAAKEAGAAARERALASLIGKGPGRTREALEQARAAVVRCRARAGAGADLEAALAVLERWPAD